MPVLIIAEKPSVAKDIAHALGAQKSGNHWENDRVVVAAARGHLVEIGVKAEEDPRFNLDGLPFLPPAFILSPLPDCDALLKQLRALADRADVDVIVNACDAGREGELIFRRIYSFIRCKKPMERMWFTTMTPQGIRDAFKTRRAEQIMKPLADAAKSRAEADWLIGINATRGLTTANFVAGGDLVSAGRVQTPTLALVVDREDAIRNFVPQDFWQLLAELSVEAGSWDATWIDTSASSASSSNESKPSEGSATRADRINEKARADAIKAACDKVAPTSVVDESKPEAVKAPKLFDLTTLQREANVRLGLSAQATLDIAQALYEKHKVLTYPRTNSQHLPEDYPPEVKNVLSKLTGPHARHAQRVLDADWVTQKHPVFDNGKISDHFAIIPTTKEPSGLSVKEQEVYDLVARRFIAAFFPAAKYMATVRTAIIAGHTFRASGKVQLEAGWKAVYGDAAGSKKGDDDGATLPPMAPGEQVSNRGVRLKAGKTTPPQRHTEATLLSAMETAGKLIDDDELAQAMKESGLGTPATRAAIFEELLSAKKGYLAREGKYLIPTPKALKLIHTLREHGLHQLASPELTGHWEARLHKIEKGHDSRTSFMEEIRATVVDIITKVKQHAVARPEGARALSTKVATAFKYKGKSVNCHCGKAELVEYSTNWKCPACGLSIGKEILSRQTKPAEVATLMREGQTPELEGFVSVKTKRAFKAPLRVEGTRVVFVFERNLAQ